MGEAGLQRLPLERVPLVHTDLGAARELPLLPHQGSGPLDLEAEELFRPVQLQSRGGASQDQDRGALRRRQPRLVQVRGGRHGGRGDRRYPIRLHAERPCLRHLDQSVLRGRLQKGTSHFHLKPADGFN